MVKRNVLCRSARALLFSLSQFFLIVLVFLFGALDGGHCSLALAVSALQSPQSHLVVLDQLGILALADLALNVLCYVFPEEVLDLFWLDDDLDG